MSCENEAVAGGMENEETNISQKIFRAIAEVFQAAQSTYAGHRRHTAVLNKIYAKCIDQGLHESFNLYFNKMVAKVLPLKKQETHGDRVIRLVASFISSNEAALRKQREAGGVDERLEQIFGSFVDQLIRFILRGAESRDKNVRYRVTQLLAVVMDSMGEIDEELYELIIWSMQKRVYDKEPNVRVQAIFCLTKLQDDDVGVADGAVDVATQKMMSIIQNDPSAEVRRAAMLNLVDTGTTRNLILERARDVSGVTRRLVYTRILKPMGIDIFRKLDSGVLERLLQWGLEDRDQTVRQACGKLIAFDWLNAIDGDIISLLDKLDVTQSNLAEKVLEAIFEFRRDVITTLKFPTEVWDNFTITTAFLMRCYYSYAVKNQMNDIIEENFPDAAVLSKYLKKYVEMRYTDSSLSDTDRRYLDFIIEQLLRISCEYDFSDEVGRRDMLNLVRNLLFTNRPTEALINIGLMVLKVLSINEKDFITMSVEIITDIRDEDIERQEHADTNRSAQNGPDQDDDAEDERALESFHEAVDNLVHGNDTGSGVHRAEMEERQPVPETLTLCLTLARYMLELVENPLSHNIMISSLIDTLITPAVRNTQGDIRELGVRCLGLCCLLDVDLAAESMYILGMCVSKGNASLKYMALQTIVDIFLVHGCKVVDGEGKVDSISLHKIFYKILKNTDLPECQALAAEGLCKLFLSDVFTDDDLFETLVLSYFSPANSNNEALIQSFAFCLPVYSYSHSTHQHRMARVASDVFLRLSLLWDELQNSSTKNNTSKERMLKPNAILQQLIDWTDPNKLVREDEETIAKAEYQLDFFLDLLKSYYRFERRDVKKMLVTNLSRFKITKNHTSLKIKEVVENLQDILDNDTVDKTCRTCLLGLIEDYKSLVEEIDENMTDRSQHQDNDTSVESHLDSESDDEDMEVATPSEDENIDIDSSCVSHHTLQKDVLNNGNDTSGETVTGHGSSSATVDGSETHESIPRKRNRLEEEEN
ncbi:ADR292Wp [Eremothecium gossypii ATCC 10895]|uniref:ADR292Wp n=1 Tax=Eremothecium gossypii (strain ATCC 10895 / CBS 109.51 / FGSC 9923 / NRRL Y-1056) TaxID=284811 RepID=Q759H3_EREGS|nr:ADR292Wp [Eremothecium gossypii ATCC 10895]AAS52212.2 ADR292Wp [Eremothecium gossypii ATCC 10895]AEY96511.1 FADR292Wp [Eremothecium gossypii FDAG1]